VDEVARGAAEVVDGEPSAELQSPVQPEASPTSSFAPVPSSTSLTKEAANALTLKQLQSICTEHNLVARGTKADMRQRLVQAGLIV
jgi:hypothetical protein